MRYISIHYLIFSFSVVKFSIKNSAHELEKKWQNYWKENHIYSWDSSKKRKDNYSIDTPPPTISGILHMGHVFSYTQADFIARFQRMKGKNVFYPIGFDNNGLPTERLVEKLKNIKAKDFSRNEFNEICIKVATEVENTYIDIFYQLGLSFDWKQKYQTISKNSRKLSQMSFLDLYKKGKIYRKFAPTFWDIKDQTAISQAEIIDLQKDAVMYEIKFKTLDNNHLLIATSRPELLSACVAVFYHPDDPKYKNLKQEKLIVPIFDNHVPIIPDDEVDINKGTGLVMCSTFGDIQDIKWWNKHNLSIKNCISLHGKMKNSGILNNYKIEDARKHIVYELYKHDLINSEKKFIHTVKCAERSGGILEILPTYQWYINVLKYKKELLQYTNTCHWYPKFMKERLLNWINGLNQDWCISRQRYFGVPFPIWYSKSTDEIILADPQKLPVDPTSDLPEGYSDHDLIPEKDVMDTWATSALTPQLSTLKITNDLLLDNNIHDKIFPFDLRPQAHEIIRTWAFGTIVKSMFHNNSVPWKNLMISGWCRASDKSKMSKSKGNTVDPRNLLITHGADVIRYWASNSKLGMDIIYNEQVLKIAKKLINKLCNSAKFVHLHIDDKNLTYDDPKKHIQNGDIFFPTDIWIISKLYQTIEKSTKSLELYEYSDARDSIEKFFWNDFCDNYLELIKTRVYSKESSNSQVSAILTLGCVFKAILRLFAIYIPHITEELNNLLFKENSIHTNGKWPNLENYIYEEKNTKICDEAIILLELVRKYRSTHNISLKLNVKKITYDASSRLPEMLEKDLKNTFNTDILEFSKLSDNFIESDCKKYKISVYR